MSVPARVIKGDLAKQASNRRGLQIESKQTRQGDRVPGSRGFEVARKVPQKLLG